MKTRVLIIVIVYMALCVSILCHEWGHSAMAWFFGIKPHIWDIHYSWKPFMLGVSENVDYAKVALLPGWQGVLISFAGPFMNFTWAVVSFVLLALVYKRVSRWVNLFLYAMHFWSVNDWFNYFTLRNIIPRGDIAHMIQFGFPHIVLLVGGLASSAIFLYMLFGPATKWLFSAFSLDANLRHSIRRTVWIVFLITQGVTLYNDIFMY